MAAASREAGIKLTLNASGFGKGLRDAEGEVAKSGSRMGASLKKGLGEGLKGGLDAVRGAISSIKSAIGTLAGVGGLIGFTEMIREGLSTEGVFKKLTFSMRTAGAEVGHFRELMDIAQKSALRWGQSSQELGKTMEDVFQETGNAEFTKASIDSIAKAATGAREPVELLGRIAGQLQKQFGVSAANIDDALAQTIGASKKGGLSLEEMSERLGVIGANAKEAGFSGVAGFQQMIALMNISKDAMGNLRKGIPVVATLLDQLGTAGERNKTLLKLGIDPSKLKGADFQKTLDAIMKATGGKRDKLALAFGAPQLQLLAELGKTYGETFAKTSGDVKTKTAAAVAAFDDAMSKAGASALSAADLQREAEQNMESPAKRMEIALEQLRQSFARPEITEAIKKLIDKLPALADIIAKLVGFAVEHPYAAAAGGAAAVFGQGAITAGASSILGGLIKGAFGAGGKDAAASIATAITSGGGLAGAAMNAGIVGAGALLAVGIAKTLDVIDKKLQEAEKIKNEANLQVLDRGDQASPQNAAGKYLHYSRNEKGELVAKESDTAYAQRGALSRIVGQYTKQKTPGEMFPGAGAMSAEEQAEWEKRKKSSVAKVQPGMSAENARLLAEMLAAKTLRVEITNPEAIGAAPGGGPPSPAPGYVPRP